MPKAVSVLISFYVPDQEPFTKKVIDLNCVRNNFIGWSSDGGLQEAIQFSMSQNCGVNVFLTQSSPNSLGFEVHPSPGNTRPGINSPLSGTSQKQKLIR